MALRNIVQEGDPILSKVCRPVEKFDGRLAQLLDDMAETMLAADGMGLAGSQVGVLRRLFVALEERPEEMPTDGRQAEDENTLANQAQPPDGVADELEDPEAEKPIVLEFVNPEILEQEGEVRGYEGCLSFPGKYGAVARPTRVKVRAQDRDGNFFEYEGTDMMARCLCHEINHLDGITIEELSEYYYDPEVPHDLDETLLAGAEEDDGAETL